MTRRKPLPKGAIGEIDDALMHNANAVRVVLAIARMPGSDGRLTEVIHYLHESSMALKRAKEVEPVTQEEIVEKILPVLQRFNALEAENDIKLVIRRCFDRK